MNIIHATIWRPIGIFYCLCSFFYGFSQVQAEPQALRYYTLKELQQVSTDSVFAIDLSRSKLRELPDIIYQFKHIRHLNLSKNKLTRLDSLSIFSQLEYLDLSKNKLDYFPVSICSLSKLVFLSLADNDITTIPPCIQYCEQLQTLDLWGTLLVGLPAELAHISSLRVIDLSAIQFNSYQQKTFRDMFVGVRLKMSAPCQCDF